MRFRKSEEESFALDLTPMIDVVFLLLIFFMVSTVFVDFDRRMELILPSSKSSVPDENKEQIEIEMTNDKQIFLNGAQITLQELESTILGSREELGESGVIRADKNLPYGDVVQVMGILQNAGIQDISVAVK
jgi:biopolymer transport protein ExbD